MPYQQIKPHPALSNYIDAFWTASGDGEKSLTERILPDGCVDIIVNIGDDCQTENGTFRLENGKAYLVGTMRQFKLTEMKPETALLGIRFKPAAFSAFYSFTSLHQVTDTTVAFEEKLSPDLQQITLNSTAYLNRFFINKLRTPRHLLLPAIADIETLKGQISVPELAKRHFTTVRQLERSFKQHVGLPPKEFINLVRYQVVLPVIRHKPAERSLLDIAFEYGYYDHSHLANEMKRYTGLSPSQL